MTGVKGKDTKRLDIFGKSEESIMDKKVYYYENTEGGHGGGANLNQRAYTDALTYAYLWMKLR